METRWLSRLIGVIIVVASIGSAIVLYLAVGSHSELDVSTPIKAADVGNVGLSYAPVLPTWRMFAAALACTVLAAASVAFLERRIVRRNRRSMNGRETPLAAKFIMEQTRGRFDGEVTVTVLVPAHNEETTLPITLPALLAQTRPPERVIVVADNCTDRTAEVARSYGVDVFETVGNTDKKAGGLNQVLTKILPDLGPNDTVMVMDADTSIAPEFIEVAVRRFTWDRALMAVGGLFYGEEKPGLLALFQKNEYTRYSRTINRRRGRVFVLTGTASLFRSTAMKAVADARGVTIPGEPGQVYDTYALTEDNELTIALKSLGALMVSPSECTVVTELMPTWKHLWNQRMRWQRGAVENIGAYGITPVTFRYWAQQLGIGYGVIALSAFLVMTAIMILAINEWVWFPFWLIVGSIFIVERVSTVWNGGWKARLLAATLFPELLYDMYLNAVFVKGVFDITFNRDAKWGHVNHSGAEEVPEAM